MVEPVLKSLLEPVGSRSKAMLLLESVGVDKTSCMVMVADVPVEADSVVAEALLTLTTWRKLIKKSAVKNNNRPELAIYNIYVLLLFNLS